MALAGIGFPFILDLLGSGNIAAYSAGLDVAYAGQSMAGDNKGAYIRIADYQLQYATQGVGGASSDTFRLQLVDQTANVTGPGTVSSSGTAVIGTSTTFLTTFTVGGYIQAAGQTMLITAITDNTHLTIEAAPTSPWSTATYYQIPLISTIATIVVPANTKYVAPVSVQSPNGLGVKIAAGQGVRLDIAGIGTGYSTTPANPRVRLFCEAYGITA
jgi:hypothetical protein